MYFIEKNLESKIQIVKQPVLAPSLDLESEKLNRKLKVFKLPFTTAQNLKSLSISKDRSKYIFVIKEFI